MDGPEHHLFRVEWARRKLAAMTPGLRSDLLRFGTLTDEWLALLGLEDLQSNALPVETSLHKLDTLPDAEFAELMLNKTVNLSDIWEAQNGTRLPEWAAGLEPDRAKLMSEPARIRRELHGFLLDYWTNVFRDEWNLIEPWLIMEMRRFTEAFRLSPREQLNALHPRLHVLPDAVEAHKAKLYRFPYPDIRQIVVRPSTFVHPHLLIDFEGGILSLPLHVQVPGTAPADEVPADLVRLFKALSDPNRLRILRYLHAQPCCTRQLAQMLSISEAAVSKHLSLLHEAKLLASERRGPYLFYRLRKEQSDMAIVYLRQFLEQ